MSNDLIAAIHAQDISKALGLIENGADINTKDHDGFTALSCAVGLTGNSGLVNAILDRGADVNAVNKDGTTALMVAAYNARNDIINLLIKNGADYTQKDTDGRTAFDYPQNPSKNTVICLCQAVASQQKAR